MIQDEKFIEGMIESSKVLLKSIDLMKQYYDSKKKEDNPVTERNTAVDSWCVRVNDDNIKLVKSFFIGELGFLFDYGFYYGVLKSGNRGCYCNTESEALQRFDRIISDEEFYTKIGYTKPTESILEKGKQVLNSQNEKQEIKREVLFTTVDGVGISQGDLYFSVSDNFDVLFTENVQYTINWANRTFSKYEVAAEWVLMNKPILSLNDLLSVWTDREDENICLTKLHKETPMFNRIKELAESKLNTK